jgi:SnoaL-like domain
VHPFRAAVEARDIEAAIGLLHPDVVFRSPVVFKPYEGRDAVAVILRAVFETFEDFRYVSEMAGPNGHALLFKTRVGDRELDGADFLVTDDDGRITELMVMVRPMSGVHALAEAMGRRLAA